VNATVAVIVPVDVAVPIVGAPATDFAYHNKVLVAVLFVVADVAVIKDVVFATVLGVPVMLLPEILNPPGNVFALYVIDLPAALDALNA
jgi:hypothetical protein